jgi:transcriptional regulator with XRE-family HTH domain
MRRIKHTRQIFGMTQQQLADYLSVTRSLLALVEQGRRHLPTAAILKMATLEQSLQSNLPYKAESLQKQAAKDMAQIKTHAKKCLQKAEREKARLLLLQQKHQRCMQALVAMGQLQQTNLAKKDSLLLELLETKTLKKMNRCGYAVQVVMQLRIAALEHEAAQAGRMKF